MIVCGLRGIGMRIVEQLYRSGEQVLVLAEYGRPEQLDVLRGWGVESVPSHCRLPS